VPTRPKMSCAWLRSLLPASIGLPLNISPKTHLENVRNRAQKTRGDYTRLPTCQLQKYNAGAVVVVPEDDTSVSLLMSYSLAWLLHHLSRVEEVVRQMVVPAQNQQFEECHGYL
jgi:hypothetical protein